MAKGKDQSAIGHCEFRSFFNNVKGVQDCEEKKKISASLETVGNRKKNVIF